MTALAMREEPDVLRPLVEVLAEHADLVPVPGFPGLWQGQPCVITAVLERTAVVEDAHRERHVATRAQVLVDERAIEWRAPRPRAGRRYTEAERLAVREAGDRRALAEQAARQSPEPAPSPPPEPIPVMGAAPAAALPGLQRIVELNLAGTGVTVDELRGPRRNQRLVGLRRTLARRLRSQGHTLLEIGRAIGRDHTTVHHLLRSGGETASTAAAPEVDAEPAATDSVSARILQALDGLQGPEREAVAVLVEALAQVDGLERELAGYRSAARRVQRRVRRVLRTDTAGAGEVG